MAKTHYSSTYTWKQSDCHAAEFKCALMCVFMTHESLLQSCLFASSVWKTCKRNVSDPMVPNRASLHSKSACKMVGDENQTKKTSVRYNS